MSLMTTMYRLYCDIQRQAFKDDGQGDWIPAGPPTVIQTAVPCLITQRTSREHHNVGGRTQLSSHHGQLEYRTAVNLQEGDVLTNIRPIINPTDVQMDAAVDFSNTQQLVPRQYRVVTVKDANILHDHLSVDLEVIQARPMP